MDEFGDPEPVLNHCVHLDDGTVTPMILTADGWLRWSEKRQRSLAVENEVLGFSMDSPKIRIKALVENRGRLWCFGSSGALVRKEFVFQPLSEESQAIWCLKLRECIDLLGLPKRLFVFVNLFGGKRAGCKIYADTVKPILEDAEIEITQQEEVAYSLDLTKYDGIICVSGDGILVEVINGLLRRDDWVDAIKMPLGVVPAGTGNGMVKSLLHSNGGSCTAYNATLAILQGLVADIDIESERYRWMGSARSDFYALPRILSLRLYRGGVSFVPAPGFEDYEEPTRYDYETASIVHVDKSDGEPINIQRHGYQGLNINLKDLNWRKFDGPFISVWLHKVPWGAENTLAAPDAKILPRAVEWDVILEKAIKSCLAGEKRP